LKQENGGCSVLCKKKNQQTIQIVKHFWHSFSCKWSRLLELTVYYQLLKIYGPGKINHALLKCLQLTVPADLSLSYNSDA